MGWYSCSQHTLASCETIQGMERRDLEHVINLYTNNHFVQENFQSPAYSWKEKIMWIPNFNRLSLQLFFFKKRGAQLFECQQHRSRREHRQSQHRQGWHPALGFGKHPPVLGVRLSLGIGVFKYKVYSGADAVWATSRQKSKKNIFQAYIGVGERRAETSAILSPAPETHSIKTTYWLTSHHPKPVCLCPATPGEIPCENEIYLF